MEEKGLFQTKNTDNVSLDDYLKGKVLSPKEGLIIFNFALTHILLLKEQNQIYLIRNPSKNKFLPKNPYNILIKKNNDTKITTEQLSLDIKGTKYDEKELRLGTLENLKDNLTDLFNDLFPESESSDSLESLADSLESSKSSDSSKSSESSDSLESESSKNSERKKKSNTMSKDSEQEIEWLKETKNLLQKQKKIHSMEFYVNLLEAIKKSSDELLKDDELLKEKSPPTSSNTGKKSAGGMNTRRRNRCRNPKSKRKKTKKKHH